MDPIARTKPTLGAYLVGAYLFSVPAFAYSESLGLLIIPQITGALLLAYAILDILQSRRIRIPYETRVYGLMGLWAVATYIFGANTSEFRPLGTLVKIVVATLACAQLIKDETDFYTALKFFVFSILFVFYQNMAELQYLRVVDKFTEEDRFAGTLANANTAATFSLTVIWACLLLILKSRKGRLSKGLYLFPIGISLLIIYYSGSKKGLIGIGLFVLFFGRLMYIRKHSSFYTKSLIVLISVCLILAATYFIYTSPFFIRMQLLFSGGSGSDINRMDLVKEALQVWLMNVKTFFVGVGYNNFKLFSDLQSYSHSTIFELLASNGIIGCSLFIAFFWLLFRRFVFLYRNASHEELRSVFFSVLIFLFIYAFFMMAAVLHDTRELLPILSCLSAFGQYHLRLLSRDQFSEPPALTL